MRTAQQEVTGLYGDAPVSIGATALSLDTQVVALVNDGTRMEAAVTKFDENAGIDALGANPFAKSLGVFGTDSKKPAASK